MPSVGALHMMCLNRLDRRIRPHCAEPSICFTHGSIRLPNEWVPDPDLFVVRDFTIRGKLLAGLPDFVAEVGVTTLEHDLEEKQADYAKFGIPECWVVDPAGGKIHVFRDPRPDGTWAETFVAAGQDEVSPRAVPGAKVVVADIVPEPENP